MSKFHLFQNIISKNYRNIFRSVGRGNLLHIEIATDAMRNEQFIENVVKVLKNLKDIIGEDYEKLLHSIHLMPRDFPTFSFPLFYKSNGKSNLI